jgi:hypothetical protein
MDKKMQPYKPFGPARPRTAINGCFSPSLIRKFGESDVKLASIIIIIIIIIHIDAYTFSNCSSVSSNIGLRAGANQN